MHPLSKKELLDAVASEVVVCTKCALWKSRKRAVPGEGNSEARVIFIGEAPGVSEDAQGRPFVGKAGRFLEELLCGVGFSRADVFICNIVKCRPPRNRGPHQIEVQTCTPYLDRQIKIIEPRFIVTLGNYSTAYVFSKAGLSFNGITQVHGKSYHATVLGFNVMVFPMFHPASALYNPRYKETLKDDFQKLRDMLARESVS
jgi:DNA polymerase